MSSKVRRFQQITDRPRVLHLCPWQPDMNCHSLITDLVFQDHIRQNTGLFHDYFDTNVQFQYFWLVAWHSGRTLVFDRRTFPVLRSTVDLQLTCDH